MTCIVGLENKGKVYIGGDSAAVANSNLQLINFPKVFIRENLIIGYTWSFRMGQIIQYTDKDYPVQSEYSSPESYLIKAFVPFLQEILKDGGWLREKDSRQEGGQFLIGIQGVLFEIDSDFAVLRMKDGYNAIGSGSYYALSVMYVLKKKINQYSEIVEPSAYMIELALESTSYFCNSVSAPFVIKELC